MAKILVLNGSPSGNSSITLQTLLYMMHYWKNADYEILDVGQKIRSYEKDFSKAAEALEAADMILFCYPVYTFLVPAQLHRFIELIRENRVCLKGKYASQITTSKHFYDITAHRFIQDNCDDLGMRYIRGLSADMEDLLNKKGQDEAAAFARYLRWCMKKGFYETPHYAASAYPDEKAGSEENNCPEAYTARVKAGNCPEESPAGAEDENCPEESPAGAEEKSCPKASSPGAEEKSCLKASSPGRSEVKEKRAAQKMGKIAIVADIPDGEEGHTLREMIRSFERRSRMSCELFNIREFPFKGGCLGCFHCASDGKCIYRDGFDSWLRDNIQKADAIVYAYRIKDHSMGSRFKTFDDRQFCNGHRTVTMGRPVGYLVDGCLSREENLRTVMEARAQVGGNFPAGTASSEDEKDMQRQIRMLAGTLEYAISHKYSQPQNFYGVGGLKIFRDLIYQMQGLMREDHRFYREHGFYDFPQKHRGRIVAMYLVGSLMSHPKLGAGMKGKMTEGMLMPYKKVLKDLENKTGR